jgi:hypothetical protein
LNIVIVFLLNVPLQGRYFSREIKRALLGSFYDLAIFLADKYPAT